MKNVKDRLLMMPLFNNCPDHVVDSLLLEVPHRQVDRKADARIAYAHDEITEVIILVSGKVHTTMTHPGKDGVEIDHFTGPKMLAQVITFAKENRLPCTIVADTECKLLYFNRDSFFDWLTSHTEVMKNFIVSISSRGKTLTKYLRAFAMLSLRERILAYLRENGRIDNVAELVRTMGVDRTSVSRVLSALKREGVVARTMDGLELAKQQ